ncbi:MAG: sugar transferase [Desulfosporosinus sp.]|nr:sugar transferase [Desulfosporosinus sp.]
MDLQSSVMQKATKHVELDDFPSWKRTLDIFGATFGSILFSPIVAIVAIIIFLTDGRPVFFRQQRIGRGGDAFYVYKFRSMRKNAEEVLKTNPEIYKAYVENNYKLPEGEDPRITWIGHILRKSSLDELPQFLNVLKGEMSLVGPRPIVEEELAEYGRDAIKFLAMKPGITGIWQVSGRSSLKYPERAWLELSYLNKQCLLFDVKTLFQTVHCVVKRTGAH